MASYNYDLFVIGAGSGGVRAARLAAQAGARVAIAEDYRIGGTCVIRGCVPKKLLVYASEYSQAFKDAKGFGWTVEWASFDWRTLRDNVQNEVSRLSGIYQANLEKAGVQIFEDFASIVDPNTVHLRRESSALTAERILVATGGRPRRPNSIKGVELTITSNEAFHLTEVPPRMVIAGGGYIAVEFASIFAGLGADVTLVYRGDTILNGFDHDARVHMQEMLMQSGVKIVTGATIWEISALEESKLIKLSNGMRLEAEQVMLALGRDAAIEELGLERVGVRLTGNGEIAVDQYSRTNVPSIFAIGDVTGRVALTPVAIREAIAFVETEFHGRPMSVDHHTIGHAVFGRPPVAAVGMTESEARTHFGDVHIYRSTFRPMKNIIAGSEQRTLMKLVVHAEDQRVLGVHIVGPDGPEMIQLAAIAVKAGLTKAQWDATCAVHPTAAEELVLMRERAP